MTTLTALTLITTGILILTQTHKHSPTITKLLTINLWTTTTINITGLLTNQIHPYISITIAIHQLMIINWIKQDINLQKLKELSRLKKLNRLKKQ